MDLAARRFAQAMVLSPAGRVDHATAERFKTLLLERVQHARDADRVVLDLAGVDYMASVGLRALVLAARQVKARGGRLVVAALQPLVREVFEISRLGQVLETFASVRDALAALDPEAVPAFEAAGPG